MFLFLVFLVFLQIRDMTGHVDGKSKIDLAVGISQWYYTKLDTEKWPIHLTLYDVRRWYLCYATQKKSPAQLVARLVRLGSSLASLQLIQVPSADAHVALVVVHALAEILHVGGARRVFPGRGRVLAGVETVVHGLGGGGVVLLRSSLSRRAGTARE